VITDVNAYLSRWPFRRTPCDELPRLVEKYLQHGVQQAWVGSLDALFHRDIGGVNLRLAEACRTEQRVKLVPFGAVNPMLPDWQEDVRRCAEDYRMPGIRLHPNYHGYQLDDAVTAELLDLAAEHNLIVQIVARMDDVRVQHPLMRVPNVDVEPLSGLVEARPTLRAVLLNGRLGVRDRELSGASERIWFEIATVEGVGGVGRLAEAGPLSQLLFGSHLPLFPLEAAILKLQEAGLDDAQRQAIGYENARRLLGRA
jgi:uncharacterized protein